MEPRPANPLEYNGRSTYREDLQKELEEINNQEIWRAGTFIYLKS